MEFEAIIIIIIILSFVFLGLHLRHMEVPRLEVYLELLLPAYATATAMSDPQLTERDQGSNLQPHGS